MANNYKHTQTFSDNIKVKGIVSYDADGASITYEKDDDEYTVNLTDLFSHFADDEITLSITKKDETDVDA